jgi:hypothetical protein
MWIPIPLMAAIGAAAMAMGAITRAAEPGPAAKPPDPAGPRAAEAARPRDAEDELDRLLKAVQPPDAFKDHPVNLRVDKIRFTWWNYKRNDENQKELRQESGGKETILDGDRVIGLSTPESIHLFSFKPGTQPLVNPEKYDFTFTGSGGDNLPMGPFFPPETCDESTRTVRGGGTSITFHTAQRFKPDGKGAGLDAEWTKTATLSVHPKLGYLIEFRMDYRSNRPYKGDGGPNDIKMGLFFGTGVVNAWPGQATHDMTFFTPARDYHGSWPAEPRYATFWINGITINKVRQFGHPKLLPDSLHGYLGGRENWGVGLTTPDAAASIASATCPAWAEFHNHSQPLPQTPDKDGFYRLTYRVRMAGLPPEIQDHIRKHSTLLFRDTRGVLIRTGVLEDFEEQPLAQDKPARGQRYEGRGVLTKEKARSGKQSLLVQGRNADVAANQIPYNEHPQVRFLPETRYRAECWICVEGEETEAFVKVRGQVKPEKNAYLLPHNIGVLRTDSARSGDGWKIVGLEFDPGYWGGVLALEFECVGPGKAYFDDFKIAAVAEWDKPAPAAPKSP